MITVKCIFKGKKGVTHELNMNVPDDISKWGNERKHSHFSTIGRKTYGTGVKLMSVTNIRTGEVYCEE